MVDANEAAFIIGCDPSTFRRLVRLGEIQPKDKAGRSMLFYRADVEKLAGTINGGRNPHDRCGMCDRPLSENVATWGPLNARMHPACVPELERRIDDVLDARYCPVCHGTRTLDMPGALLDAYEPVPCVCVRNAPPTTRSTA